MFAIIGRERERKKKEEKREMKNPPSYRHPAEKRRSDCFLREKKLRTSSAISGERKRERGEGLWLWAEEKESEANSRADAVREEEEKKGGKARFIRFGPRKRKAYSIPDLLCGKKEERGLLTPTLRKKGEKSQPRNLRIFLLWGLSERRTRTIFNYFLS